MAAAPIRARTSHFSRELLLPDWCLAIAACRSKAIDLLSPRDDKIFPSLIPRSRRPPHRRPLLLLLPARRPPPRAPPPPPPPRGPPPPLAGPPNSLAPLLLDDEGAEPDSMLNCRV